MIYYIRKDFTNRLTVRHSEPSKSIMFDSTNFPLKIQYQDLWIYEPQPLLKYLYDN